MENCSFESVVSSLQASGGAGLSSFDTDDSHSLLLTSDFSFVGVVIELVPLAESDPSLLLPNTSSDVPIGTHLLPVKDTVNLTIHGM